MAPVTASSCSGPRRGRDPEQLPRRHVHDPAVLDRSPAGHLLAKAATRLRDERHVLRVAAVGVLLVPPGSDVEQILVDTLR